MGHYSVHHNETLFPESHSFIPERWLDNARAPPLNITPSSDTTNHGSNTENSDSNNGDRGVGKPLSRYMVSFSKGSRQCIGMNLAYAELYIGLATVFRRVNMSLFETGPEAVETKIDIFVPRPMKGSKGVRAVVESVE
jgi:cytochrome P450